jgi:hypothetical protein
LPKRESNAVPRSQIERLWFVAGGVIAFVMLLVGYFFFISPQRSNTSDINSRAATVRQQNVALQARLDALREQNKNLPKYQAELAALKQALPSDSAISDFLRTLQSLGNATLTDVQSLTVGEPAAVVAPVAAAPTGATSTSAPVAPATPTDGAAAPEATVASAYSLSITASVAGSANALTKFLDQLQEVQPRAVLISNIGLSGGSASGSSTASSSGGYTLTLTMKAFVAPVTATAGAPVASSTAAGN